MSDRNETKNDFIDKEDLKLEKISGGSVEYNTNNETWNNDKNIPTAPSTYKIGTDVQISEDWKPPISFEDSTISIDNDISGGIINNLIKNKNN